MSARHAQRELVAEARPGWGAVAVARLPEDRAGFMKYGLTGPAADELWRWAFPEQRQKY